MAFGGEVSARNCRPRLPVTTQSELVMSSGLATGSELVTETMRQTGLASQWSVTVRASVTGTSSPLPEVRNSGLALSATKRNEAQRSATKRNEARRGAVHHGQGRLAVGSVGRESPSVLQRGSADKLLVVLSFPLIREKREISRRAVSQLTQDTSQILTQVSEKLGLVRVPPRASGLASAVR